MDENVKRLNEQPILAPSEAPFVDGASSKW